MRISFRLLSVSCTVALVWCVAPARAAGPAPAPVVLLQGPQVSITDQDVQADAQLYIPPQQRNEVLARPDRVAQMVSDLYVRRALAGQAKAAGLADSPQVLAALRLARDRVLSDAMLDKIGADNVPDAQALEGLARNEYNVHPERYATPESVRVQHILVRGTGEDSKAKADALLDELNHGADFSALAKAHSEDPGSAAKGGDLGFFAHGKMVPEFEQAAFALQKPGDLSDLVKTQFGYHILRLEARRPASTPDFAEVRETIERDMRARVLRDARLSAAGRLRQDAKPDVKAIEAFSAEYTTDAPSLSKP